MLTTAGGCLPPRCQFASIKSSVSYVPDSVRPIQCPASLGTVKSLRTKRTRHGAVMQYARRHAYSGAKCMLSPEKQGQPNTSTLFAYLNLVNDATKWMVSLTSAGTLIWCHNIYVSWCFLGSIMTVFGCKALKKIIKIQRPADARKQDPGMPSSHATSLAYLSTYLALAWHPEPAILSNCGLVLAVLLIPLRVILGYHTIPQVLVGACFGATSAAGWHTWGQQIVLPGLETSLTSRTWLAAAMIVALTCYAAAALRSK